MYIAWRVALDMQKTVCMSFNGEALRKEKKTETQNWINYVDAPK